MCKGSYEKATQTPADPTDPMLQAPNKSQDGGEGGTVGFIKLPVILFYACSIERLCATPLRRPLNTYGVGCTEGSHFTPRHIGLKMFKYHYFLFTRAECCRKPALLWATHKEVKHRDCLQYFQPIGATAENTQRQ